MVLSVRNNNPGNIRPLGSDSGFQGFSTPEDGLDAMRSDLMAKISGSSNAMKGVWGEGYTPTLETLLSVWAPPSENDTQNYIKFVSDKSGIDPNKELTLDDIEKFMPAMVQMEGGQQALDHFYGGQSEDIFPDNSLSPDDIAALEAEFGQGDALSQEDFAALEAEFGNQPQNSKLESFGEGFRDSASIGLHDELGGFGRAVGAKIRGDERPFTELYGIGRDSIRQEQAQAREDNPWTYTGGQLGGALAGAVAPAKGLASVAKLQKYARTNPLRTAAATGGISGGIYGFNSGEGSGGERLKEGAVTGGLSAAAGPIAVRAGNAVGSLFERAQRLYKPQQLAQTTRVIPAEQAAKMQTGEVLPMTKGQFTQDPSRQAMEQAARKGGFGDNAQDVMQQADIKQQQAIRGAMDNMGAGTTDDLAKAGNQVRSAYKAQKAATSQAYDNARAIQNVYVNKAPISEQFVPKVQSILKDGGFDLSDLSPQGKKIIESLDSPAMKSKSITAVNLEKMEFWRRKVSNNIAENTQNGVMKPEAVAMKRVLDEYDRFMSKLPEDALKSGDEKALEAINKARTARRTQGVLFERDKAVQKIVQSQDITDEELANMVLTGSARSEKINSGSGRLVRNLKRAVGDNAPQLQEGIKRGTLARMIQRGTTTTTEGNSSVRMIDASKLRGEFDNLVKNKTFMKEVFSPEEIETINAIHRDLIKIGSQQAGTNNYSNTAYALMRFVNIIPFGKASIGEALQGLGNASAAKDIKKGLSPVLEGMLSELNSTPRFYGAMTTAPLSNKAAELLTETQ